VLVQPGRHSERVLPADGDERVDAEVFEVGLDLLDASVDLERVGARGPEDGPATRQDPAYGLDVEGLGGALERVSTPIRM
jgi:hypothetical protein